MRDKDSSDGSAYGVIILLGETQEKRKESLKQWL